MPVVPVYLKDRTYWKLVKEADKLQVGVGKIVSMIADEYVKFAEQKGGANGKSQIQTRS